MAGYTRISIYNYIVRKLQAQFSSLYCTSKYTIKPESFPAICLWQYNKERIQAGLTLNDTDEIDQSDFQLDVTCDGSTMQSDAYKITEYAEQIFKELHYRLISQIPVDNTTTYTITSHFRRIVGGDEVIPTISQSQGD